MTGLELLAWAREHHIVVWAAGVVVALVVLGYALYRAFGSVQKRDFDARTDLAFAVVQTGVAIVIVTGTYEFFRAERLLDMPKPEAIGAALIIEACVWVCVGMIFKHANGTHPDPKTGQMLPNVGTGPGGYGFAVVSTGGGILAVFGSSGVSAGIGRTIIVGIGVTLWWMKILTRIRRMIRPGRFMYSPYRIALRRGWVQVTDEDVDGNGHAREWQVRQLARSMRLASHRWPLLAWWGGRTLTKLQDSAPQEVLIAARDRHVRALAIREQVKPESDVIRALVASARHALDPAPEPEPVEQAPALDAAQVGDLVEARMLELLRALPTANLNGHRPPSGGNGKRRTSAPRPSGGLSPRASQEGAGGPGPYQRDEDGKVIGLGRDAARTVDGEVLVGDALRGDGLRRLAAWRAAGEHDSLGVRLAREYDPPMGERWAQKLAREVPQASEAATGERESEIV